MTTFCPTCLEPVDVKAGAREGRCADCRPQRQHSRPRSSRSGWVQLLAEHDGRHS